MKKYMITAMLCCLFSTGCVATNIGTVAEAGLPEKPDLTSQTEIAVDPDFSPTAPDLGKDMSEPPAMRIEIMTAEVASVINLTKCGYSWTVGDGDKAVTSVADSVAPYQLEESGIATAKVNTAQLAENPKVLLFYGGKIKQVLCWSSDGDMQEVGFTDDGEIMLPNEPVGAVYSIDIAFPQGSCTYVFTAFEGEAADTAAQSVYADGGMTTPAFNPNT